jgi:ComEC/Rec2-related protein
MKFLIAPRQPFIGLVLAAVAGIIAADFFPINSVAAFEFAILLCLSGIALFVRPNLILTYALAGLGFFLVHSLRTTDTVGQRLAAKLGDRPRALKVTGAVVTEPKPALGGATTFLLQLHTIALEDATENTDATILVRWRGNPEFGDELTLFGIAEPISPPRNPGEFDMRSYLARRDVYRHLTVRYSEDGSLIRHRGGDFVLRAAQQSRTRIQQILSRGLEDAPDVQNFINGLALGLRHQTPEDIEEPFQQTGTLHLFAVAGLHVGIVAQLLWLLASVSRLSRKWAAALIIPALLFYACVTGLHISSIRAAVMASILLAGFFVDRKVLALNSLAAAAFLLLAFDTQQIFSTGFQLSFAVVGTIILLAEPFARLFGRWTAPDPFLPRSLLQGTRRIFHLGSLWAGKASSVSLTAWLGSLLLILWYFNLVTPISLLANLVVVPIAFCILALALLSLVSAPMLPWLSVVFNNANWSLARLVIGLVHFFAQWPAGHYYIEHPHWPDGVFARINVLDLGAGAAVHVRGDRANWLFDCGSERDYERLVREYLHTQGVNNLSGLLLSHGDSLHIGGAGRIVADCRPALIIDNPLPDRSAVHGRLRSYLQQTALVTKRPVASESFSINRHMIVRVLYPPRLSLAKTADDQSLVVQLVMNPTVRVLFMGDSGVETEKALLRSGVDLGSDILIKGQHHSLASGSAAFLEAVRPRLIIATSRDFPENERIKDEWVEYLRQCGIRLFRQDQTGAVLLKFSAEGWEARSYMTGEIFRSSIR